MLIDLFYSQDFVAPAMSYSKYYHNPFATKASWYSNSERISLRSAMKIALARSGQPFFDKKLVVKAIKSYYYANQVGFKSKKYAKAASEAAEIANNHNITTLSKYKSRENAAVKIKIPRFKGLSSALEWVFSALKAAIRVLGYGGGAYIVVKQISDLIKHLLAGGDERHNAQSGVDALQYLAGSLTESELLIETSKLYLNKIIPLVTPLLGGIVAIEAGMFIGKKLYALFKKVAIYSESNEAFGDTPFARNLQDAYYIVEKNNGRMSERDIEQVQELLDGARVDVVDLEQKLGGLHKLVQIAKGKLV